MLDRDVDSLADSLEDHSSLWLLGGMNDALASVHAGRQLACCLS
jgi:hypothetical protein